MNCRLPLLLLALPLMAVVGGCVPSDVDANGYVTDSAGSDKLVPGLVFRCHNGRGVYVVYGGRGVAMEVVADAKECQQ